MYYRKKSCRSKSRALSGDLCRESKLVVEAIVKLRNGSRSMMCLRLAAEVMKLDRSRSE
jgi:hypothetical protein